jgi:hypothetical protein
MQLAFLAGRMFAEVEMAWEEVQAAGHSPGSLAEEDNLEHSIDSEALASCAGCRVCVNFEA